MIDARKIKDMLNERAEQVCGLLLPSGFCKGHQWTVGDIKNTPPTDARKGGSLNIELSGSKVGVWCDFADNTHKGSNLLELWMAAKGCDFKQAITEAKAFLGIKDDGWRRAKAGKESRESSGPKRLEDEFVPLRDGGRVNKWLTETRKITAAALKAYRIGESKCGNYVVFPSYDHTGKLQSLKFRHIEDKSKMFVLPSGGPKMLFGIQAIDPKQGTLIITEGELDALAMWDYHNPAVSVPFGAKGLTQSGENPNDPWIEHDFDWMEQFVDVLLCLDNDKPGQEAVVAIAPRLGYARCRWVTFPEGHKDANECRTAGIHEDAIWDAIADSKNFDPQHLRRPSDFRKEVWEKFYPADGVEPGEDPPWNMPFKFRPAQLTIWQGFTKHGKTVCLSYLLCWFAHRYKKRSCIASMEIPARSTLQNMMRQSMGKRKPETEAEFNAALEWMDQHFWLYDKVGTASVDDLLAVFRYAAKKYGIKHFVLDSLMKLDVDEEEDRQVKGLLNKLCDFAKEMQVHVHLVCHSKKPDARHPEEKFWPGKYQVRGSAHIVDMAHNVICVWRNKGKEQRIEEALAAEDLARLEELKFEEDALFLVQAQREGDGDEPVKRLWYDAHESWQYRDEPILKERMRFVA
jgi:twinkle protein